MTPQEHKQRRQEITSRYQGEIWEHESAGCYGDAENCRKWMKYELERLEEEYRGKAS